MSGPVILGITLTPAADDINWLVGSSDDIDGDGDGNGVTLGSCVGSTCTMEEEYNVMIRYYYCACMPELLKNFI